MDFLRGTAFRVGCERLAVRVAVANFYVFLLRRLTLTTASPLKMLPAAPRVNSDSRALSAKLVRMCEITQNWQRCKKIFENFCQRGGYGGNGVGGAAVPRGAGRIARRCVL